MKFIQSQQLSPRKGAGSYYIHYVNLCISDKNFAQKILDENLKALPLINNEREKKKNISLCNLALNKGAQLKLPTLKVRPKTVNGNKENWIYDFENKEIIENVEIYDFLIKNPRVSDDDKCKMDSILIQSMMADLVLLNYKNNTSHNSMHYLAKYLGQKLQSSINTGWGFSALEELERILYRGHVFRNPISSFLTLSSVFGYREIFDNLGMQFKLMCFHEFSKLSIIGKKALTSILIKSKNEEAIFNLLGYGLKLNWDIKTEDGKNNLVAFEMLYSLQWVKAFIDSSHLDIRLTNSRGENILHLIGTALSDQGIEDSLRRRLNELNQQEREYLFFQLNEENLTPLMKAVVFQDEKVINFISDFNIKPWDEIKDAPAYKSPMELLNECVLNSSEESSWGHLMDYFKESFWIGLAKQWNSQFYYQKLQKDLLSISEKSDRKSVKI